MLMKYMYHYLWLIIIQLVRISSPSFNKHPRQVKEWNNFCICDKGFVCRSKNLKCHLAFNSTLSYDTTCNFEERPREEGGGRHLSCIFNLETSVGGARALSTTARSCGRAQHFSNAIYKRISQCVKVGFLAKISRISPTVLCVFNLYPKYLGSRISVGF